MLPSAVGLLMADPEHRGPHDENDDKEDGPGIDMAVGFGSFRVITHCIASCRFLLVIADDGDRRG
jgi:hypothetical protein